jgi:hypothetical protein
VFRLAAAVIQAVIEQAFGMLHAIVVIHVIAVRRVASVVSSTISFKLSAYCEPSWSVKPSHTFRPKIKKLSCFSRRRRRNHLTESHRLHSRHRRSSGGLGSFINNIVQTVSALRAIVVVQSTIVVYIQTVNEHAFLVLSPSSLLAP